MVTGTYKDEVWEKALGRFTAGESLRLEDIPDTIPEDVARDTLSEMAQLGWAELSEDLSDVWLPGERVEEYILEY